MSIRKDFEKRETSFIAPYGCLSSASRGRAVKEKPCKIRTAFQIDRDRIVYSNGFRRLKYKTQVFLSPLGDQYRTRLTHTLEVAEMARTIARALCLNEDLTEAISLGHDLGHTPFGHSGESILKEIYSPDFSHNRQSLRVVDKLEKRGEGLNLTHEVRDGILKHSKGLGKILSDDPEERAETVEGQVVRVADIMAYLNHDLDDAIRSGVITEDQVPDQCSTRIGRTHSERATKMIKNLIYSSKIEGDALILKMSDDLYAAMVLLREFLYENVYRSKRVHKDFEKARKILTELYHYFLTNENEFHKELINMELYNTNQNKRSRERQVCDFIASMTDRYAMNLYTSIFFPSPFV